MQQVKSAGPSLKEQGVYKKSDTEQIVGLRLGGEEYGIGISEVQEIILVGEITRLPHVPDYIRGLINLRSSIIPVIDLRRRFGFEIQSDTPETRVVVVSAHDKTFGLLVDAVTEVLRVEQDQKSPLPSTISAECGPFFTGLIQLEDRLITLLNVDKVLSEENDAKLTAQN
jgi:purine-binding chemotaxis protein CheW